MQNNQMMECSRFKIELDSHDTVNLYAIYRNPASSAIAFCEELATIFKDILVDRKALLLMGDFNIHIDNTSHASTNTFNDFLDSFNLKNHIYFPTHFAQHTLHLFMMTMTTQTSVPLSGVINYLITPSSTTTSA